MGSLPASGAGPDDLPTDVPTPALRPTQQKWTVTLVTGDRVVVTRDGLGNFAAAVLGSGSAGVMTSRVGDHLYVVPLAVRSLVGRVLDPALFDVRGLISEGLDDASAAEVPVIVSQAGAEDAGRLEASTGGAVDARRELPKLGLVTGAVVKKHAAQLGRQFAFRAAQRTATTTGDGLSGMTRMWLGRTVQVTWDPNLEQVGAPAVWASGVDGTGVKIAVLDTGIDTGHPDIAGKVQASKDFTGKGTVVDGHGHGTHVAGLAAGSGAGNDGERKGVAPGAGLLIGKVLADEGTGSSAQALAGMEWAVAQGADVVNMSLGGLATDGTDVLSQAVNQLSKQGTLFVIAAGNSGPGTQTVGSPGAADAALTVAAADANDAIASFSSRGPRKGNRALKPDVSSPGVGIAAARAAGTTMGTPLDDNYTRASGTSMATPQVAGAAALLLQRHPAWTPEQVKAALAGTADPVTGADPHAQGAGRIDVQEALVSTVFPEDEDADLGILRWPQPAASTHAVGWRNEGGSPVTFNLALDVRDSAGQTLPSDVAWLSDTSVTVPAGGRAETIINVNAQRTTPGQAYVGYLTATSAVPSSQALQIPVGFVDEVESYDLVVRGIDRDGAPAAGQLLNVDNVDDLRTFSRHWIAFGPDGVTRLRLPVGNYHVNSVMYKERNVDPRDPVGSAEIDSTSIVTIPDVAVTADQSVTVDARTSVPSHFAIEGVDAVSSSTTIEAKRTDAKGGVASIGVQLGGEGPVYLPPDIPATRIGDLTTVTARRMVPRQLTLRTTGAHARELHVTPAQAHFMPEWTERRLVPIDVGSGSQGEFDSTAVRGRLAVVRRGESMFELARRAKSAGAAILAVTNDRSGIFRGPFQPPLALPTIVVDGDHVDELRTAAAGRQPVAVVSRPFADTTYDLVEQTREKYVVTKTYNRRDVQRLGRYDARYPVAGQYHSMLKSRFISDGAGMKIGLGGWDQIGRARRTEYISANYSADAFLQTSVRGRELWLGYFAVLVSEPRTLRPAEQVSETWFGSPTHTVIGTQNHIPILREGNSLYTYMSHLADADGHRGQTFNLDGGDDIRSTLHLYRNGVLLTERPGPLAVLSLPAEPARYRLLSTFDTNTITALRTRSISSWEFDSARPESGMEVYPLPEVDYDVELDDSGRLKGRSVTVNVLPQAWPTPAFWAVPDFTVRELRVSFSIDDGRTWRDLNDTEQLGDKSLQVQLPKLDRHTNLSLRTHVVTNDDVRHSQTVIRAVQTN